jgi:hypothetical protein
MLRTETITINGKEYIRTWSDANRMIERDGNLYESAVDPAYLGRTYTETEQDIPDTEAEEADYLAALDRLGVSADE